MKRCKLIGTLSSVEGLVGNISAENGLVGVITLPKTTSGWPYEGPYEFTPTEDTQTINIADKTATADITINPIPSNYGRIAWNGNTLMVY